MFSDMIFYIMACHRCLGYIKENRPDKALSLLTPLAEDPGAPKAFPIAVRRLELGDTGPAKVTLHYWLEDRVGPS